MERTGSRVFFSLVDVVEVLADTTNPTDYLKKMRKRDVELGIYLGTNCPQMEMEGLTGKKRKVLAGNTRDVLRLVQSILSPKVVFYKWFALLLKNITAILKSFAA